MRTTLLLACVATLAATLHAQPSSLDTTYVLDPIVVTATRMETERRNLPGSVTVVSVEELQMTGATGVLDAVAATTPGVFVTQRGVAGFGLGTGSAGRITIRGVGGTPNNEVLVLVDGRPDFVGLFGHPLPDAYSLSEVDRVEIVRGPASAVSGTNAMGGVINIITKRKKTPGATALARMEAGPWATYDGDVTVMGLASYGVDYRLTTGYTTTDGHRPQADFRRKHLSVGVGVVRGPWDFHVQGSTTPFKGHDPGPDTLTAPPDHWIDIVRNSAQATARYRKERLSGTLLLHGNWGTHRFYDGWHSDDHTVGMVSHTSYRSDSGMTVTLGFDASRYGGNAVNDTTGADYGSHSVAEYAPSATLQVPFGSRANVIASARIQHHAEYGWFLAPEGGVSIHILPRMTVRGSVARGFRSPDIRALYLFEVPKSQPTIRPERVLNAEAGIGWRAFEWLTTDLTAYRMRGDDIIGVRPPPPFPPTFENRTSFVHHGVEAEARWWFSRFHGRFFTAWQDVDEQTGGSAEFTLGLSGTVTVEKFVVTLDLQRVDGLYGEDNHVEQLPSYNLLNATILRPIGGNLDVQLVLRNLLDATYETMPSYPMPGFHALVGLRMHLGGAP